MSSNKSLSKVTDEEIKFIKNILEHYRYMKNVVRVFEQRDKVDTDPLIKKRRTKIYDNYVDLTQQIEKSHSLLTDEEMKLLIELRYIQGYSYKETIILGHAGFSKSTLQRRLKKGIDIMANHFKSSGVLDGD
ncbi:hypothetical protein PMSD_20670 [Paenibacillus macquariensis subsp. defensor]|nr:hypothetical protein PMSD_20670 [Paenibacillus macquariensis subsp. defensor]